MLGGYDLVLRAVRRARRARALQQAGRQVAAMAEVTVALKLLARPRVNKGSPPAVDTIIRATLLLDELAQALGNPSSAKEPIRAALRAIEECRGEVVRVNRLWRPNLVELHPDRSDPLREHEEWLRHRLACIAG